MTEFLQGDIIRNKNYPGVWLVLDVVKREFAPEWDHYVLVPLTQHGYPSLNHRLWKSVGLRFTDRYQTHGKYPKLFVCSECERNFQTDRTKMLNAPLKRLSIYEDLYRCKRCKNQYRRYYAPLPE